ncbi:hypothetical protein [Emergencia timonensis]|nr:hypothetical protein [Emergencia timonensis]
MIQCPYPMIGERERRQNRGKTGAQCLLAIGEAKPKTALRAYGAMISQFH